MNKLISTFKSKDSIKYFICNYNNNNNNNNIRLYNKKNVFKLSKRNIHNHKGILHENINHSEKNNVWYNKMFNNFIDFFKFGERRRNKQIQVEYGKKLLNIVKPHSRRVEFYTHCGVPDEYTNSFGNLIFHVWVMSLPLRANGKEGRAIMDELLWALLTELQKELHKLGESSFMLGKRGTQYQKWMYGNFKAYDLAARAIDQDELAPFVGVIWRNVYRCNEDVKLDHVLWYADYALTTFYHMCYEVDPTAMLKGEFEFLEPPYRGPQKSRHQLDKFAKDYDIVLSELTKPLVNEEQREEVLYQIYKGQREID